MNPSSERARQAKIADVYDKLHEGKLGAHWLWCVIEMIAAGQSEEEAMRNFGYYERAALSTQPQQAGWKMVPVTITDEMRSAAVTAWVHSAAFYGKPCAGQRAWDAALSAAPLPPVPGQEGEQHD